MIATNKHFYDTIKLPQTLFPGGLSQSQVNGIEAKITACNKYKLTDLRQVGYVLATSYHETDHSMQPVRENGRGAGRDYGKKLKMGGGPGKRIPYTKPDQIYYGRGDSQTTWYENYAAFSRILGIDLLNNPDLALQPDISADILLQGMIHGYFTGKKLSDYFNDKICNWTGARWIVNGQDCADKIAGEAQIFYHGLAY